MTNITEFIDLELGMAREEDSDWGLFIILDEEDTMVTHRRLLKNILRISTIYEDADEDLESEPEFSNGTYANEATCPDSIYGKMDYYNTANWIPETTNQQDDYCNGDNDGDNNGDNDGYEIIQSKMQFLVTYALTTSFSIALIILTFTI